MQRAYNMLRRLETIFLYHHSMRLIMIILTLFLGAYADDWALVKEQNGIRVYTRSVEGSDFLEFRGETVVEGSVAALVAVLYDTPAAPAWLHQCSFGMTLDEISFEENYIFQIYDLPFPVSNRKMTLHAELTWLPEGARLETHEANSFCSEHSSGRCDRANAVDLPEIKRSRGHYIFRHRSDALTEVVWQLHIEPGGYLPTWLANMLIVDIPYRSLLALKTLVKDEKYSEKSEAELKSMWSKEYHLYH